MSRAGLSFRAATGDTRSRPVGRRGGAPHQEDRTVGPTRGTGATAMYLRCYPYDTWRMACHHEALLGQAVRLGLGRPHLYLDNGFRSRAPLPALEHLLRLTADGGYRTVLVPGPFVFSLDDTEARGLVRRFTAAGCEVLELLPTRGGS
ncbi:hypothetical protein GCM10010495_67580 [Kitasatospora herbaricolor]|uniref:hypothetical protein n=1 Tax=Kitasatospora herbaricolor TaxID=68217 RepID=UPI001747E3D8|nr:hypothetical protein [Kitasatospora herbaricolor]MDQ0312413.1 hypothetical protein [Kitasatospora herbaricolor]GGV40606.1 hypothetical protein GCM10010495_67580 [Kitasatospora herbaricolor]